MEGIYTIEQAARLARVSPRILRRWINGEGEKEPAFDRKVPLNDADVIGFVDLIQALTIRALRKDRRITLQKVRDTIIEAEKLGVFYPFARKHKTYLFADDIVIKLEDGRLVQVTGKYKQQDLIKPVVELYLDDLSFDSVSGLANEYVPLRDADENRRIVISPKIKYGAPIVHPCGYTVGSLINAVDSEGSIESAAEAYDVNVADVKFALRYDDFLVGIAA
jgi:uncharacterized protein (DUF433 family)